MSILGVVIRVQPKQLRAVKQRLARMAGVDLAPDTGNGRLAAVIESTADTPAAAIMSAIGDWSQVLNLSLVFEYSDAQPAAAETGFDFHAWRGRVGEFARQQAQQASLSVPPVSTSAVSGAGETR